MPASVQVLRKNLAVSFDNGTAVFRGVATAGAQVLVEGAGGVNRLQMVRNDNGVAVAEFNGWSNTTGGYVEVARAAFSNNDAAAGAGQIDLAVKLAGGALTTTVKLDQNANVVLGKGAVTTTATDGFVYVPTVPGTPTGVPTAQTGLAAVVVDTTNNKFFFRSGGAWVAVGAVTIGAGQVAYATATNTLGGEAAFAYDAANNRLGVGQPTPLYALDVAGGVTSQIHFGNGTADSGGYLTSTNANQAFLSGGLIFNGAWIAKSTATGMVGIDSGSTTIYGNTGQTIGAGVSLAELAHFNAISGFVVRGGATASGTGSGVWLGYGGDAANTGKLVCITQGTAYRDMSYEALSHTFRTGTTGTGVRATISVDGAFLMGFGQSGTAAAGYGGFKYHEGNNKLMWSQNNSSWVNLDAFATGSISITANQVAYGTGANAVGGNAALTFSPTATIGGVDVVPSLIIAGRVSATAPALNDTSGFYAVHRTGASITSSSAGNASYYVNYFAYTINRPTATGGITYGLYIAPTVTALGSSSHVPLLVSNGASNFLFDGSGNLVVSQANNLSSTFASSMGFRYNGTANKAQWYQSSVGTWVDLDAATVALAIPAGQIPYGTGSTITSEAAFFYDATNNRLGVGQGTPLYAVDVAGGAAAQIHFGNGTTDSGGYLISTSGAQAFLGGGVSFASSNWIAKNASPTMIGLDGGIFFYADTGRTIGASFSPTQVASISQAGALSLFNSGSSLIASPSSGVVQHIYNAEANQRWVISRDAIGGGLAGLLMGPGTTNTISATGVGVAFVANSTLGFYVSNGSALAAGAQLTYSSSTYILDFPQTNQRIRFAASANIGSPSTLTCHRLTLYADAVTAQNYSLGVESGNMWFNANGGFKFYTTGTLLHEFTSTNVGLFGTGSYGGGSGVVFIKNRTTAPTSNPTGGPIVFADGGALWCLGTSGTLTMLAAA